MIPILETQAGRLYEGDCLDLLRSIKNESVDLAFADPPFNLGKDYSSKINDDLEGEDYIRWCKTWIDEIIRTLVPGGSFYIWNIPKWNLQLGSYISESLTFRNWISVDIKYSLPIQNRLYPAHYSLLYFVKGKRANIFHPDRLPVPCCRHCGGELRDYGGYKSKMNPSGVSLTDVWTDIPPVRHAKYKKRDANALALKLMDRIISMSSDPGSIVMDPFGGSGTTYIAAELTGRQWIGSELDCSTIVERFARINEDRDHLVKIHSNKNVLFTENDLQRMKNSGRKLSPAYRVDQMKRPDCDCQPVDRKQSDLFVD